MAGIKNFMKKNGKLVIPAAILLAILLAAGIYFAVSGTNDKGGENTPESSQTEEKAAEQEVEAEELQPLQEKGIFTGVNDREVEKGAEGNLEDLVTVNRDYVKSVSVDDSRVDYHKEGPYEVFYTIAFDGEKLRQFLKEENITVPFDTDGGTVIIKTGVTVTVTDKGAANEETGAGDASTTSGTVGGGSTAGENPGGSTGGGHTNTTAGGNSGGSGGSSGSKTAHEHVWVTRTETVQEPITVIVDSKKQEYTLYRFYWYTTGTWEESRDGSCFNEWSRSAEGALYPLYHPYEKPEDNPLFQGYDDNGNPTYTNDHAIISGLFEWVPCEPYEETRMTTVTRTVTICSVCGAAKQAQ